MLDIIIQTPHHDATLLTTFYDKNSKHSKSEAYVLHLNVIVMTSHPEVTCYILFFVIFCLPTRNSNT